MALKRALHWETRHFHEFLMGRASAPFAWGSNDCALFAADGIKAITGVDIAAEFRGQYHDEASALEAIEAITGGKTVEDAAAWCAQKFGLSEWQYPLCARRADLVVVRNGDGLASGLVHLNGKHVVFPGERGLVRVSIRQIVRAWHYE